MIYTPHKTEPGVGYTFWHDTTDDRWFWRWEENRDVCMAEYGFESLASAMRSAADDWDLNGDSGDKRFSGMLRGLATRSEKTP